MEQQKKLPEREQVSVRQMTLRISNNLFEETQQEADAIGSSQNSFICMMIKLGLKVYNGQVVIQQKVE